MGNKGKKVGIFILLAVATILFFAHLAFAEEATSTVSTVEIVTHVNETIDGNDVAVEGGTLDFSCNAGATVHPTTETSPGSHSTIVDVVGDMGSTCATSFSLFPTGYIIDKPASGSISTHLSDSGTRNIFFWLKKEPVNQKPVITLSQATLSINVGGTINSYESYATTSDPDGDAVTLHISGTANVAVAGIYTIHYTAEDSHGLSADPKDLIITVVAPPPPPPPSGGGGGGGCGNCGGGGGGAVVFLPLTIQNDKVEKATTTAIVTWNTSAPATSRVVYGCESVRGVSTSTPTGNWGYASSTIEKDTNSFVSAHTVIVALPVSCTTYYFRAISKNNNSKEVQGSELMLTPTNSPEAKKQALECPKLLTSYMKKGMKNDRVQVTLLQAFLSIVPKIYVPITGTFDRATDKAVRDFQIKYPFILTEWGYKPNRPTGYVYYSTQREINGQWCSYLGMPKVFQYDPVQAKEIADFRAIQILKN